MRYRRMGRALERSDQPPSEVLADPVTTARVIGDMLPGAIERAEAAGLSLIAQHLAKALQLAERIVASGENAS